MGLSPFNPGSQRVTAGKLVLARIDALMEKGDNFAIETTLSGLTLASRLKIARKKGYHIRLFCLHTTDIRINIKRIKYRVSQGGHHVPSADVRRHHKRGLRNLFNVYYGLCDTITVWDNTGGEASIVAVKLDDGNTMVMKQKNDIAQAGIYLPESKNIHHHNTVHKTVENR